MRNLYKISYFAIQIYIFLFFIASDKGEIIDRSEYGKKLNELDLEDGDTLFVTNKAAEDG